MRIVTRLASPPEYRKLAPWFKAAGQAEPTLADMVLLAETEGELCGALRVVMAGVIRLDSVIARDDEVLATLLQQLGRWIGREACWAVVSPDALPVYLAAGFVEQAAGPDTLVNEAATQARVLLQRPVPVDAEPTEAIALAASGAQPSAGE
ncbi:hypothetical protein [Chitinibacter tainanensis]|uniref:hypothetical protein n=1 Tax=Chitinibacter tainanensis TaxID=230667 RepID=UPI0023553B76|nr:hypothetical protein [Chitinibacter tainanensis]